MTLVNQPSAAPMLDNNALAGGSLRNFEVPPYGTPVSDAEKKALERVEDEAIDRLFALNAKRAEEERREATTKEKPAKGKGGRKKKGNTGEGQGTFGIG